MLNKLLFTHVCIHTMVPYTLTHTILHFCRFISFRFVTFLEINNIQQQQHTKQNLWPATHQTNPRKQNITKSNSIQIQKKFLFVFIFVFMYFCVTFSQHSTHIYVRTHTENSRSLEGESAKLYTVYIYWFWFVWRIHRCYWKETFFSSTESDTLRQHNTDHIIHNNTQRWCWRTQQTQKMIFDLKNDDAKTNGSRSLWNSVLVNKNKNSSTAHSLAYTGV